MIWFRDGGGAVAVGGGVVVGAGAVVVGRGGVVVPTPGPLVAPGGVATMAGPVELFPFEIRIAASAPSAARTRKTNTGQIQSPGYQPRPAQAEASRPKTPLCAGSRSPHSRQYSWPGE